MDINLLLLVKECLKFIPTSIKCKLKIFVTEADNCKSISIKGTYGKEGFRLGSAIALSVMIYNTP